MRVFVPTGQYVTGTSVRRQIDRWVWRPQKGVLVYFKDGMVARSNCSLRDLESLKDATELPRDEICSNCGKRLPYANVFWLDLLQGRPAGR